MIASACSERQRATQPTPTGPTAAGWGLRIFAVLMLSGITTLAEAQMQYAGTLGTQPIHLSATWYSDGVMHAAYVYDRHDTPIVVNGKRTDGVLELLEKGAGQTTTATLRFPDFDPEADALVGSWIAGDGSKQLPIRLQREFTIEDGDAVVSPPRELLQAASDAQHYFTALVDKAAGSYYPRVTAINVYRKGTDELLQRIELDVEYRGIDNVSVGDYNFDGIDDLSVFEASYAGPNTTSLYFLREPDSDRYVPADFPGTSLDFDAEHKLVHEYNQCCGGRETMSATYRVVGRGLELVERTCMAYDDAAEDHVEVPCDDN